MEFLAIEVGEILFFVEVVAKLLEEGWRVAVVWECSITGRRRADKIANVAEWLAWWLEEDFYEPFVEV